MQILSNANAKQWENDTSNSNNLVLGQECDAVDLSTQWRESSSPKKKQNKIERKVVAVILQNFFNCT